MTGVKDALQERFGDDRVRRGVPLRDFTTFRVGGPADFLVETRTSDEIVAALALAHRAGVPVTMLGGGSNVLVSDAGVRGLVIRPRGGEVRRLDRCAHRGRCGGDDQRSGAVDYHAPRRRPRGVGRHAWHGWRRRSSATRISADV